MTLYLLVSVNFSPLLLIFIFFNILYIFCFIKLSLRVYNFSFPNFTFLIYFKGIIFYYFNYFLINDFIYFDLLFYYFY